LPVYVGSVTALNTRSQETEQQAELIASRLLAQNALAALRGPMSRGAVPAKRLADELGRPRNTVTRLVSRSVGASDATPFDLAARRTLDADRNGHQQIWEMALRAFRDAAVAFRGTGVESDDQEVLRKVVSEMMVTSFTYQMSGDFRFTLLNTHMLHAAALACDPLLLDEEGVRARNTILELCQQSLDRVTTVYVHALRLMLRGTARRVKVGYTEADVVYAMHSLYDGYILRHLMDPDAYPLRRMVDMLWDLAVGLTEPGFLQESGESDTLRHDLLRAMLGAVRDERAVPALDEVANAIGVDPKVARALFPDESKLAETCIDFALAGTSELRDLAVGVRGIGIATLEEVLRSVTEVCEVYRPLVEGVPDAPVWGEMRSLAVRMLEAAGDEILGVDAPTVADILIRAATRGNAGEREWTMALELLRCRGPQAAGP
jgi:hypothetical protein